MQTTFTTSASTPGEGLALRFAKQVSRKVGRSVLGLGLALVASGVPAWAAPEPLQPDDLCRTLDWVARESLSNLSADKLLGTANAALRAQLSRWRQEPGSEKPDPKAELEKLYNHLSLKLPGKEGAVRRGQLLRNALQAALMGAREDGTQLQLASQYIAPPEDELHDRSGIGIMVDHEPDRQGHFVIFEVLDGFPASKAGIRPGDRIVEVGGHRVVGASYHQVGDLILGRVGTQVHLNLLRPKQAAPQHLAVSRVWLNPNPKNVSSRLIDPKVGYIRFKYLGQRMDVELKQILGSLQSKTSPEALILDLRNNEGVLEGTIDVAACFAPKGSKVTSLMSKTRQEDFRTTREPLSKVPLVVLVNRYTDGPGVLLAGALRDLCKARLVGEPTIWHSQPTLSQTLRDGSVASVCTGYYTLPQGQVLRARRPAVVPEVRVDQDPLLPLLGEHDEQFNAALQLARKTAP